MSKEPKNLGELWSYPWDSDRDKKEIISFIRKLLQRKIEYLKSGLPNAKTEFAKDILEELGEEIL